MNFYTMHDVRRTLVGFRAECTLDPGNIISILDHGVIYTHSNDDVDVDDDDDDDVGDDNRSIPLRNTCR